jgi:hypothetical protein
MYRYMSTENYYTALRNVQGTKTMQGENGAKLLALLRKRSYGALFLPFE